MLDDALTTSAPCPARLTEAMVRDSIAVYKRYRNILESPLIPLRRPDGRDFDGYLHVNPALDEKGLLVLFNPLDHPITRTVRVPLRYTGLTGRAEIALFGENPAEITFTIPAKDVIWYTVR